MNIEPTPLVKVIQSALVGKELYEDGALSKITDVEIEFVDGWNGAKHSVIKIFVDSGTHYHYSLEDSIPLNSSVMT